MGHLEGSCTWFTAVCCHHLHFHFALGAHTKCTAGLGTRDHVLGEMAEGLGCSAQGKAAPQWGSGGLQTPRDTQVGEDRDCLCAAQSAELRLGSVRCWCWQAKGWAPWH